MKKSRNILTRVQLGEIMRLYVAGEKIVDIARKYNASSDQIRRAMSDLGVYRTDETLRRSHPDSKPWTGEEVAYAEELKRLGYSASVIGSAIGRTDSAVRRKLSQNEPKPEGDDVLSITFPIGTKLFFEETGNAIVLRVRKGRV